MSARHLVRDWHMRAQPIRRLSDLPLLLRWPVAAWRAVQAGLVRWEIVETERYLRACERDGLVDSLSLRDFRGQLQALRIRLSDLTTRY